MAKTPPFRVPTWATDGGASVTDPTSGKQAAGWVVEEAPSVHHWNFVARDQGRALDMLMKACAPHVAIQNTQWGTYTVASSFTPDGQQFRYDTLASRWYMSTWDVGSGAFQVAHNTDNDTTAFSAWDTDINGTYPANAGSRTPVPHSNGTICATIADDYYFQSSDLDVGNFDAGTQGAATWAVSKGFVWDTDNDLWLAAINDTTGDGEIWSAATDFSGGFTLRSTPDATYGFTDMATSPDRTVAVMDGPRCYSSVDGTTWSQNTSNQITNGADIIWFDPNTLNFFAIEITTGFLWSSTNGVGWTDINALLNLPTILHVLSNDNLTYFLSDTAGFGTAGHDVWCFNNAAAGDGFLLGERASFLIHIGTLHDDLSPRYGDITTGTKTHGGAHGEILFEYSASSGLANGIASMRYTGLDLT